MPEDDIPERVSALGAELRAHMRAIGALREDQVELRREFATVHAGLRQIVGLIEGITPE